jgi:hypothetical protein
MVVPAKIPIFETQSERRFTCDEIELTESDTECGGRNGMPAARFAFA